MAAAAAFPFTRGPGADPYIAVVLLGPIVAVVALVVALRARSGRVALSREQAIVRIVEEAHSERTRRKLCEGCGVPAQYALCVEFKGRNTVVAFQCAEHRGGGGRPFWVKKL